MVLDGDLGPFWHVGLNHRLPWKAVAESDVLDYVRQIWLPVVPSTRNLLRTEAVVFQWSEDFSGNKLSALNGLEAWMIGSFPRY